MNTYLGISFPLLKISPDGRIGDRHDSQMFSSARKHTHVVTQCFLLCLFPKGGIQFHHDHFILPTIDQNAFHLSSMHFLQ